MNSVSRSPRPLSRDRARGRDRAADSSGGAADSSGGLVRPSARAGGWQHLWPARRVRAPHTDRDAAFRARGREAVAAEAEVMIVA